MQNFFIDFVNMVSNFGSNTVGLIELLVCGIMILICFRGFGKSGLYAFTSCVMIIANIQVMREAQFFFQDTPVALGTISFSSLFLVSNILTERYGSKAAALNVYLSFLTYVFFVLIMMLTLSYSPKNDAIYKCMVKVFQHSPILVLSGLTAYLVSQLSDIYLFALLKHLMPGKKSLWFRNTACIMISSLIDNIVFSVLAWYILPPNPVSLHSLIFTYVLGTYWIRVAVGVLGIPFLYAARRMYIKD